MTRPRLFRDDEGGFLSECQVCFKLVEIPRLTETQIREWQGGTLIQNAMPDIPRELREMLISGYCAKC